MLQCPIGIEKPRLSFLQGTSEICSSVIFNLLHDTYVCTCFAFGFAEGRKSIRPYHDLSTEAC